MGENSFLSSHKTGSNDLHKLTDQTLKKRQSAALFKYVWLCFVQKSISSGFLNSRREHAIENVVSITHNITNWIYKSGSIKGKLLYYYRMLRFITVFYWAHAEWGQLNPVNTLRVHFLFIGPKSNRAFPGRLSWIVFNSSCSTWLEEDQIEDFFSTALVVLTV